MSAPLITLDRPYELKWNDRAQARLSSLERPPTFRDLTHKRRGFYALCAIVWASIIERGHRFADPEDLAEFISTDAQQEAAVSAVNAMLSEAFPMTDDQKKTQPNATGAEKTNAPSAPVSGPSA